jgi:hypothetical protein
MKLELIREKNNIFPEIKNPEDYNEVEIWHCNYKSLDSLSKFINAETISIATFPDYNLNTFKSLIKLKKLGIIHLPNIKSIESLKYLINLEELNLSTLPSWDPSGKRTIITSLRPLSKLKKLKALYLAGVVPEDGLLEPLIECENLEYVHIGNYITIEQRIKLLKYKKVIGNFFDPFVELNFSICKKCNSKKVMLSGVIGRQIFCPICNKKRVDEHLSLWRTLLIK